MVSRKARGNAAHVLPPINTLFSVRLCRMKLCWVKLCWVKLFWVRLCWVKLCWVRRDPIGSEVIPKNVSKAVTCVRSRLVENSCFNRNTMTERISTKYTFLCVYSMKKERIRELLGFKLKKNNQNVQLSAKILQKGTLNVQNRCRNSDRLNWQL